MNNLKTLLLFGLTMLGSCQKQEQKQDATADSVTNSTAYDSADTAFSIEPEAIVPTVAPDSVAPEGFAFCVQSEDDFYRSGLNNLAGYSNRLILVFKNKEGVCVPCTQIAYKGSDINIENSADPVELVRENTRDIPREIYDTNIYSYSETLKENCDFPVLKHRPNSPPGSLYQYRSSTSGRTYDL